MASPLQNLESRPRPVIWHLIYLPGDVYVGWIDDSHSTEVKSICILDSYFKGNEPIKDVRDLLKDELIPPYRLFKVFSDREGDMQLVLFVR